jgi:hypothetical protein
MHEQTIIDYIVSRLDTSDCKVHYDGGRWEYIGFYNDGSCGGDVGISMEKSMNNFENGKLAHYSYHFAPFAYRKMMFSHEIDVCQANGACWQ